MTAITLPANHAQRIELNDEVHARPTEPMAAPLRISYLALLPDPAAAGQDGTWAAIDDLAKRFGAPAPAPRATHYSADFGPFRLKWERHTEFSRCMIIAPAAGDPFAEPAIGLVPADWVAALPGRVILAAHVGLLSAEAVSERLDDLAEQFFDGNGLVGAAVLDGAGRVLTDFRIHADGFSRFIALDDGMTPAQAGRVIQRLLEIDTYRIMALLALPVAQGLAPDIAARERELAGITDALVTAQESDESMLLERLTTLAAAIESRAAANRYRFTAARAYYDLVHARIAELREARYGGLQTLLEFTERRLAPAMNTCQTVAARQEGLLERVARTTQLLSTRVGLTRERQNHEVLQQMSRRAAQQLRLQQTVEGLSVAAMTYYIVGLVGYAAKGLIVSGLRIDADIVQGIAIPFVAVTLALAVRRVRRRVTRGMD